MTRRSLSIAAALALVASVLAATSATASSSATFAALNPGGLTRLAESVDVNIVYVGIDEADLGVAVGATEVPAVDAGLPDAYRPMTRYKLFYGKTDVLGRDLEQEAMLGLEYTYDYHHVFADDDFEDAFEEFLLSGASRPATSAATLDEVTLFQEQYNDQKGALDEIDANRWIDAPKTEAWLAAHANDLDGVDPTTPTVFFIDASDAGFHTYVKVDTVDPDTGYNFGEIRASRKMTAWGGTPGTGNRVWFYDLSAGPEGWSDNWNVDDADLDGDGVADYRIPPIWHYAGSPLEYTHPGAGTASLGTDLGKVTRYVALNLLFTSSPLYPPYFKANRIPSTVELDVNTVEWWNKVDVSSTFVDLDFVQAGVDGLPAGPDVVVAPNQDLPFSGDWARCYQGFSKDNKLCFNDLISAFYLPFANPFLAAARNTKTFLDDPGDDTYEAGLVNFGVGTKPKNPQGLLGFADDNWLNGTQSGVFSFVYPEVVPLGYGLSTTMTHEYGHHSSMSHPHDGFDYEDFAEQRTTWLGDPFDPALTFDYGPGGATQYAWLGDMSHTIMSYMDLATGFGQFDQDNSARHHAAGYAKIANAIAGDIPMGFDLGAADDLLAEAQSALADHDYPEMLDKAKAAYEEVVDVAEDAGVPVEVDDLDTWTIAGPIKPGNGNKNQRKSLDYAKDLNEKHNVKRVYSK